MAVKRRQALVNAHMNAQARFSQNPADVFAADELMAAIDQVQASAERWSKAEAAAKSSGQALAKAQVKLDGARQQAMAKAKTQMKREITELHQKQEGAGAAQRATLPFSTNVSIAGNNADGIVNTGDESLVNTGDGSLCFYRHSPSYQRESISYTLQTR